MEHAHAAVAMMALAAAFASAAAAHVHEEAARAADGIGGGTGAGAGQALHSHVGLGGGSPAVATLTVANAGRVALVSANATACGASGLLGRAAGDAEWSLRRGAAASVSWAAPCAEGRPVLVRVEYAMADGTAAAEVHRACAAGRGGAPPCAGGGAAGGPAGGISAGGAQPAQPGAPGPPPPRLPAPAIASCAVSGLSVTVCASGGPGGGAAGALRIMRQVSPGPPGYALAGTVTPPAGGGIACHADAAPRNSAAATYRASAGAAGGQGQERHSLPARADFAAQQCYVSTPGGERIGSPGGPPAPLPASRADYRIAVYEGLGSTPLTVEARFGPDRVVVERQPDGSWSRLGYHPSHPRDSLSEYLPAERVARGASGEADVRYARADLLRHLDAFWGARQ